jgi:hypothetical protein
MVVRWCFPHNFQYIYIYTNKLCTFLSGGCYISNITIFVWSPWPPSPEEALFWAHLLRRTDLLEIDLLEPALMHWEAARTGGFLSHGNTPNSSNIEAFSILTWRSPQIRNPPTVGNGWLVPEMSGDPRDWMVSNLILTFKNGYLRVYHISGLAQMLCWTDDKQQYLQSSS